MTVFQYKFVYKGEEKGFRDEFGLWAVFAGLYLNTDFNKWIDTMNAYVNI